MGNPKPPPPPKRGRGARPHEHHPRLRPRASLSYPLPHVCRRPKNADTELPCQMARSRGRVQPNCSVVAPYTRPRPSCEEPTPRIPCQRARGANADSASHWPHWCEALRNERPVATPQHSSVRTERLLTCPRRDRAGRERPPPPRMRTSAAFRCPGGDTSSPACITYGRTDGCAPAPSAPSPLPNGPARQPQEYMQATFPSHAAQ